MEIPPGTQMPGAGSSEAYMPMNMMMGMQMSFYWGKHMTLLFAGWPNGSLGMYVLALFFVFFLAAGVEVCAILASSVVRAGTITSKSVPHGLILQSCIYVFQMALAYTAMLSVMSFNVGVFIVAVAGHGVGHFTAKSRIRMLVKGEVLETGDNGGGSHA